MRKYILATTAAAVLALAAPAMAYDSASPLSMQDALDVATDIGLTTVSYTGFIKH